MNCRDTYDIGVVLAGVRTAVSRKKIKIEVLSYSVPFEIKLRWSGKGRDYQSPLYMFDTEDQARAFLRGLEVAFELEKFRKG